MDAVDIRKGVRVLVAKARRTKTEEASGEPERQPMPGGYAHRASLCCTNLPKKVDWWNHRGACTQPPYTLAGLVYMDIQAGAPKKPGRDEPGHACADDGHARR